MDAGAGTCLGCAAALPPPFLDLGSTPLANAYLRADELDAPEPRYPLAVTHCRECHLVQLTHLVPPERMFTDYRYYSSYSASYLVHASAMADELCARFGLGSQQLVLEVGSNDGYLLQYFAKKGVRVVGVEPARNIAEEANARGITTVNEFFSPKVVPGLVETYGRADVLIGNNVLAHVPDVNGFLSATGAMLAPHGVAVFEFPSLLDLLDGTEFDTIYHEHVFYLSLTSVTGLARRAGLDVVDVSAQDVHGGSLRVFIQHRGRGQAHAAVAEQFAREGHGGVPDTARYEKFRDEVAVTRESFVELLRVLRAGGARVAGYGAPAKGNTLLNTCGIGADEIAFTVDRNVHKQGLYLPGSHIPIYSPDRVAEEKPDYLVILPWNLAGEIREQMSSIAEWGGRFVVPIPTARVLP